MRILATTAAFVALTSAHHKCDDVNTAETNSIAGPLAKAVQKAREDMELAQQAKTDLDNSFLTNVQDKSDAEENLAIAVSRYNSSNGKVTQLHEDYASKTAAFAACKPDDPGTSCDLTMQSQLALQMQEAGQDMIDNDTANQTNRNVVEQMTLELNKVNSEYQFDSASFNTKATRLIEDLDTAAATYQNLSDQLDRHTVTGTEQQEDCMLGQYHNDMAEIERLTTFLELCKNSGCTQQDLERIGGADGTGDKTNDKDNSGEPPIDDVANQIGGNQEKKYREGGKIRFPDCGVNVTAECFWLHYKQSGWLDFLSFFCYIPALIGCAIFDEYEYGLCLGNFAYIVVDASAKKMAPYAIDF